MNNTGYWDQRRGKIYSRKGGWRIGEAVYCHGYSMMEDLVGEVSYFQVLILNVTGRLPERRFADCMEALFTCLSYPDDRIWCNQIGSLAGTLQASGVAAVSAGVLASDSYHYGVGPIMASAEFIVEAVNLKKKGMSIEEIVDSKARRPGSKPKISGYMRPVASGDERIEVMESITAQLGFSPGEHLSTAYEVSEIMQRKYNETMNINGYGVAFFADHGFSAQEMYRMFSISVNSGVTACYIEAAESPPESFLPLRCNDIDYQGHPPRELP
ncbi:hypothetical protein ACFLZ5_07320 [Thermodesulfobacteriota bacterium]